MGKDNNSGLFGVALGALIVGTTLALRDFFEAPKNREAVRRTASAIGTKVKSGVSAGIATAKTKVEAGVATAKPKVEEGIATAKTKVGEGIATVKTKVEEGVAVAKSKVEEGIAAVEATPAVKKIRETVEDIRRAAADPAEQYFREDEDTPAEDTPTEDTPAEDTPALDASATDATAVWDTPEE